MKLLPFCITSLLAGAVALSAAGTLFADDGEMFRKNVSKNPAEETEHAALRMLPVYVPAQSASGELLTDGIEYYNADGGLVETRYVARPLITHYTEGHSEGIEEEGYGGFPGHGHRDAFGAVSLDDGASWTRTNLSKSGDLSSIRVGRGRDRRDYPGDVGRSAAASDGNQVLIVWVSRYARGGNPTYAMSLEDMELVATHLALDVGACTDEDLITTPCPYLEDHFSVAGSQGVSDLADEGLPLIGELPYAAVWAARGVILPPVVEGEASRFVWFKPERLTSAVRDANRPEAACVMGAGCVVTWQEDPEGIRPGDGEGPGEGWSGAVAHHKTDTWYSYISWKDFALVQDDTVEGYGTPIGDVGVPGDSLALWVGENETGSPAAAIPMSIPVRLTDNDMCVAEGDKPYCYVDFDGSGTPDFCAASVSMTVETPEGPTQDVEMCITEDGRLMRGNTASTRARLGLHGYSSACRYDPEYPETCPIDSAWFYMAYEENKGLGEDGDEAEVSDDPALKIDMGKNIWYHTFDMANPELVSQGMMLNQPAVYWDGFENFDTAGLIVQDSTYGYNFYRIEPDPIYETQAGLESTLYQTEIARRSSPISQNWYDAGASSTVALQLWKQGIIRRGGPADIMGRLFVMPEEEGGDTEICTLTSLVYYETTYEQLEQTCYDETQWVAYTENTAYKPDWKKCTGEDMPLKCYPYIDPDGNGTFEEGIETVVEVCTEEIWNPVDSCDAASEDCRSNEAKVAYCDANLPACRSEETSETVDTCDGLDNCSCESTTTSGFDPTVDNPYDYGNMLCEDLSGNPVPLAFADGTNPRYVKGFCPEPAINLSANTIVDGELCEDAAGCLEIFPFSTYFDDLAGGTPISKIYQWEQYGPDFGMTITDPTATSFDDVSWENPYDVAKGHRGFMSGDMIMAMYAWAPNWQILTMGHEPFNLYNRRSFDGGRTWTTTPGNGEWDHGQETVTWTADGNTTCEWMPLEMTCESGVTATSGECAVCDSYGVGVFERARNVSQLTGYQTTVLDPRYSPTTGSITLASVGSTLLPAGFAAPGFEDDIRDPSYYFMVYETGRTSAYDAGEAEPLDLFYSRAIDWGDEYLVWQDDPDPGLCIPSTGDDLGLTGFCNEFDALEGSQFSESGEASVTASPGGMFFYSVWNQVDFGVFGEDEDSDAWFRRVMFLDEYVPGETTEP